ncbi:MAG: hypothetical protein JXB07_12595 [Anaerolineae bacterium]|nr:hypothetical protein [Anaerolineae bacterium]
MKIEDRPVWPATWWWVMLAIILLGAGMLRYTGYNFSLPYVEHLDEPALTTAADSILSIGTAKPIHHLDAYPPGIVTLDYFLLRWFHNPTEPPTTILSIVRLLSITATLGIGALIALLGYRVAGPLSGLLASWLWGGGTIIVEYSRYGTADNFTALFAILAILLTSMGTLYSRNRWLTLGVICLILAIVFKYQAILLAPAVFLMPLWRLKDAKKQERQHILRNYADNLIIFSIFMFWLIMLTPVLGAKQMAGWDEAYTQKLGIPSVDRLFGTMQEIARGYEGIVIVAGLLGLGVYLWKPTRGNLSLFDGGIVFISELLWIVGISCFGVQNIRQSITAVALLAVLLGIGLMEWASLLQWLLNKLSKGEVFTKQPWIGQAVVCILVVWCSLPQLHGSIANAREHTLPDRRNDLALWFETTLNPGLYIADKANHKTFDRYWGGFPGQKYFPLFAMEVVTQRPLQEWRDNEVLYAIVPYSDYQEMLTTIKGQKYLDQMVMLKSYPPNPNYRGPSMVIFRIYPMQNLAEGRLGPIDILGYDIDRTTVSPGDTLTISYYWRASQSPDVSYQVFTHILPLDSTDLVAQQDGHPLELSRPTTSWDDPHEIILSQPFSITIGDTVPSGEYKLVTGFYELDTGQRLNTSAGDSYLNVTHIWVK